MILLILAAAASATTPPTENSEFGRVTDAEFCAMGKEFIASISGKLPIQSDAITRSDRMSMLCPARQMVTDRSISVGVSEMAADWRQTVHTKWSATTCRNPLFNVMARKGWRFTQTLTFKSGERVTQDADCSSYTVSK